MRPKILVVEELPAYFDSYTGCCLILGYDYHVCHDVEQLPKILETFKPNIVFWILSEKRADNVFGLLHEPKSTGISYYAQLRQQHKEIKVVLAYDFEVRWANNNDIADYHFRHPSMSYVEEFQYIISELLFTNLYDKSSRAKWVKVELLNDLSENALRSVAAERMWSGEQSYLEQLTERKKRGDELTEKELQSLGELLQIQEFLRQRKAKAVEILIERGVTESADELMNPPYGIPNFGPMEK